MSNVTNETLTLFVGNSLNDWHFMTLIGIYRMKANNSKEGHWMLNRWIAKNPHRHSASAGLGKVLQFSGIELIICVMSGDISCKAWSNYFCCWGDNSDNCSSGLSWTRGRPPLSSPSAKWQIFVRTYSWFALSRVSCLLLENANFITDALCRPL